MKLRRMVGAATAGLLVIGMVTLAGPASAGGVGQPGTYQTVSPVRVLDTRSGIGAPAHSVAPLSTITFTIPDEISPQIGSVLLEVTAVNPTARGYATVFGAGTTRPTVSNVNFQRGQNVPNTVIVKLAGDYEVSIFNGSNGTVDLLADVQGYFVDGANQGDGGTLVPVTPRRYLDTRSGLGTTVKGKVAPLSETKVQIGGVGGVPVDAAAVAVNITAVQSGGKGYITAYPGTDRPDISTVNFYAGEDRANLTLVGLDTDGSLTLFNGSPFAVDLLADVSGYFVGFGTTPSTLVAGAFVPALFGRIIDTRQEGTGSDAVPSLATLKVPLFDPTTPDGALIISQVKALAVNVTSVDPQAGGFFTTWDGTTPVPAVSNVNFRAKRDSAGSIVVPLNSDGSISVYNGSFGSVDMLVDLTGLFTRVDVAPTRVQAAVRAALGAHRQPTVIAQR